MIFKYDEVCFRCRKKIDVTFKDGGQTVYAGFHNGAARIPFYNSWRLCTDCSRGLEAKITEYLYTN